MGLNYKLFNYFIDVYTKDSTVNWNGNRKLYTKLIKHTRVLGSFYYKICILVSGLAAARPVAVKQNEDI